MLTAPVSLLWTKFQYDQPLLPLSVVSSHMDTGNPSYVLSQSACNKQTHQYY